jgi:hypothetical protein
MSLSPADFRVLSFVKRGQQNAARGTDYDSSDSLAARLA